MSLKKLLTMGFGAILALILTISVIPSWRFYQSNDGFHTYRELALTSVATGRVQENILDARLAALKFIRTHNPNEVQEFDERISSSLRLIDETMNFDLDSTQVSELSLISEELKQYKQGFDNVVKLVNERNKLVNEQLSPSGEEMSNAINELVNSVTEADDFHIALDLSQLQ